MDKVIETLNVNEDILNKKRVLTPMQRAFIFGYKLGKGIGKLKNDDVLLFLSLEEEYLSMLIGQTQTREYNAD